MEGKYRAMDVAYYIVNKSIDIDKPISNLQLQKILFKCQVEYCRETGSLLVCDDFEAWQYGPVVPSVYREFCLWGGLKIRDRKSAPLQISRSDKTIVDKVVSENAWKSPWALVEESHQPGTPWHTAYRGGAGDGSVIPKKTILDYCHA